MPGKVQRDDQIWLSPTFSESQLEEWTRRSSHLVPCPEGALTGTSVSIFWDLDSVPLFAPYDLPNLRPHDQFDLMLKVFGVDTGAQDVSMMAVVSEKAFLLYDSDTQARLTRKHIEVELVKMAGGANYESTESKLGAEISTAVARGRKGDTIVLISGDNELEQEVRRAKVRSMNVLLLAPGKRDMSGDDLYLLAHWAARFKVFVQLHKAKHVPKPVVDKLKKKNKAMNKGKEKVVTFKRPSPKDIERAQALAHQKDEREQTELDLLIIIDGTASMQRYIDKVKEAIANEVVTEVVRRYPSAAGRVRYGVLIYRDFCDKDRQFERLDFTTDVSRVVAFLDTVKATGGGDPAEDVVGAMMEALRMDWKQRNKAIFHILDAPAHGQCMHDMGMKHDDFHSKPPPGRKEPEEEAKEALRALYDIGVHRYVMCHLDLKHCTKMARTLHGLLRQEGIRVTQQGSKWLVEHEVTKDPTGSAHAEPSQLRLADLVGKLIGATLSTLSAALSSMTLARMVGSMPPLERDYEPDIEMPTWEEVDEEEDEADDPKAGREGLAPIGPIPHEIEIELEEWDMSAKAKQRWSHRLMAYKDVFKRMRRQQPATRVEVILPPDYGRDLESLLRDVDRGIIAEGKLPDKPYRDYLVRPNPPPGFRGSNKVAFLAQELAKGDRVEHVGADGTKTHSYKGDYPIVVLKEYLAIGRGMNSEERYMRELQAAGVAMTLANIFNDRVAQVKDKLSAEPKRLSYLPTCLVKYQSFASGHVNGVSVGTKPITIFRLQEPLVMGNFVKWSSNAGYVNMEVWDEVAHAFTHWTYHATEGRLMVADIQGVRVGKTAIKLTDPQIHCAVDPTLLTTTKESSLGRVGMLKFFQSHRCGETCKALGLSGALEELDKLHSVCMDISSDINSVGDDADGAGDDRDGTESPGASEESSEDNVLV